MDLNKKIEDSIRIIRKMEKMAFKYSPDGFHVAFSGGKDSQVIYELAKNGRSKIQSIFLQNICGSTRITKVYSLALSRCYLAETGKDNVSDDITKEDATTSEPSILL
jgi:predicted phosphoadenosine phosphosulfate sulfurtransferase